MIIIIIVNTKIGLQVKKIMKMYTEIKINIFENSSFKKEEKLVDDNSILMNVYSKIIFSFIIFLTGISNFMSYFEFYSTFLKKIYYLFHNINPYIDMYENFISFIYPSINLLISSLILILYIGIYISIKNKYSQTKFIIISLIFLLIVSLFLNIILNFIFFYKYFHNYYLQFSVRNYPKYLIQYYIPVYIINIFIILFFINTYLIIKNNKITKNKYYLYVICSIVISTISLYLLIRDIQNINSSYRYYYHYYSKNYIYIIRFLINDIIRLGQTLISYIIFILFGILSFNFARILRKNLNNT